MNVISLTSDDCLIFKKQLMNNGRVYPYYYSIWFDTEKDDFDFCIYDRNKVPLANKDDHQNRYRLYIDGKYVKINKSLKYRIPEKHASNDITIVEMPDEIYEREGLWWKYYSTGKNIYTELTDMSCHPYLK